MIPHTIIGSPYGTNLLKVEKMVGTTWTPLAETNLFSIQGRYATNSGVDVARATYTLPATGDGTIDVFATSEADQSIQVSADAALGFATTTLSGEQGRYFGRLPLTAPVPPAVLPVTISSAVHAVGTAAVPGSLVVTASSSDAVNAPVLTATGFGDLVAWTATFPVNAPPSMITVTSSRGGSATIATSVSGGALAGTLPVAAFLAPDAVSLGQPVVLDAAPSTGGPLTGYAWSQVSGPAIRVTIPPMDMTTPTLSFTPTAEGPIVMQLVVTSAAGPSLPVTRTITVTPPAAALTADAGLDQTMQRGKVVTLDASATLGALSLAWAQTGGPAVTLSSATVAKPTFTYSLMPLPNAAVGNPNDFYLPNNFPLTFTLTATGVDGVSTATDTVVITPSVESITGVTARYRTVRGEWRVTGTTNILAGQRVAIVLGPLASGRTIGTATVDPAGAFSVRAGRLPDPRVPAPDATQVTVVSATGGIATAGMTITP